MSKEVDNKVVNTVDDSGKKLKLVIKMPGHKILQEAQMVYNIELTSLIRRSVVEGAQLLSKQQLDQYLIDLGIWTEADAKQFIELQLELRASEFKLQSGGSTVGDGKKIAIDIKIKRQILLALYNRRAQFDGITMESMADNKKFKFLMTQCVSVYDKNQPLFINMNDYDARQNEQASVDAATALAGMLYGYDEQTKTNLVENKWLEEFGFADKQGRLVNDKGQLVDVDDRLVDESGRFVDQKGNFVDNEGRPVDEDGNFIVKARPFLDDVNGKPLVKTRKKSPKKKRKNAVS